MATIRQRGGKWQVQVRRTGLRAVSKSFVRRQDAEAWARLMEVRADRDDLPPDRRVLKTISLRSLVQRYQSEVTPKKRGARIERAVLSRFTLDPICDLTLADIRPDDFIRFRERRLEAITPGTLKRQLNPLRHMFRIAREEWGIPLNEKLTASLRFKARDTKRNRRLRPGEFDALMKAANAYRNPMLEKIIQFAIATGMRRGEILSMRREHIDVENRLLSIPLTKNGHPRTIPLSQKALVILKDAAKREVIFPIKRDALRLAWDRIVRRAGIEDLRFHDLRHEAISRFFELGLTIPEVATISGHRDATMLFRYAHASERAVFAKLNARPAKVA